MRRAVDLAVNQILRSRYGLAALIAILVLAIVASVKVTVGPDERTTTVEVVSDDPILTVDPETGDDGLVTPKPPPQPVTSPGADEPVGVARTFTNAWLKHTDVTAKQWHARLTRYATKNLSDQLDGVDPAGVPAERVTGEPVLIPRGTTFVEVTMPVDSGRLLLRLIAQDGRWLVDGVDWERA